MKLWKVYKHSIGAARETWLTLGNIGVETKQNALEAARAIYGVPDPDSGFYPGWVYSVEEITEGDSTQRITIHSGMSPDEIQRAADQVCKWVDEQPAYPSAEELPPVVGVKGGPRTRGVQGVQMEYITLDGNSWCERLEGRMEALETARRTEAKEWWEWRRAIEQDVLELHHRIGTLAKALPDISRRVKMADIGVAGLERRDEEKTEQIRGFEKLFAELLERLDAADREWDERNSNPGPGPGECLNLKIDPLPGISFPAEYDAARSPKTSFTVQTGNDRVINLAHALRESKRQPLDGPFGEHYGPLTGFDSEGHG